MGFLNPTTDPDHPCRVCGSPTLTESIPCPDGLPGCCVAHLRQRCLCCERTKQDETEVFGYFDPEAGNGNP